MLIDDPDAAFASLGFSYPIDLDPAYWTCPPGGRTTVLEGDRLGVLDFPFSSALETVRLHFILLYVDLRLSLNLA